MKSIKNALIFIICLTATNTTIAQSFKKFAPKVAENARIKDELSLDDDVENVELYKNIPKDFVNFKSAYLYIDPVQGIYEKLMMETQQPERWEKFNKRFSVPDTLRIYDKKLLNNKLGVFYMLDKNQNATIVVDKNGNMDLSDDEIFKISTTANLNERKVNLDLPVKLYNASTNSVKDSLVALEMIIASKSAVPNSKEDVIIRFSNRKSLTAEIVSENFKYIFSWVPLLSANRKYLGSDLPLRVDIMDKKDSPISFRYQNVGDTMIIDNHRTIIKQYNGDQLILQTDKKEIEGYQVGQLFRPVNGIDIFNPDKKIDISSKKYLVFDFWGTWCAPCIAAMPELVALEEKYKKKADLISIVSDDRNNMELAKKIIKAQKLVWPQIWDERTNSSLTNALQIQFFPTMIVINKEREIVFITTKIKDLQAFLEKVE